jgi:hypothetical protein
VLRPTQLRRTPVFALTRHVGGLIA